MLELTVTIGMLESTVIIVSRAFSALYYWKKIPHVVDVIVKLFTTLTDFRQIFRSYNSNK